jgi:ubiquinol-cytochrome c reductase iron-sulfur subunit
VSRRRAEAVVIGLLFASAVCATAFVVLYAADSLGNRTQVFGLTLGGSLACLAAALIIGSQHLVEQEELEEDYGPEEEPEEQETVAEIIEQSDRLITRKRLLAASAATAAGALGTAIAAPALSLGPLLDTDPLYRTPWKRGRRLIDESGHPLRADAIEEQTFYTAFPEGASRDDIGAPLVVVRVPPRDLRLPAERAAWAPGGILAYSKICTHAGCAIALYRKPTFAPTQPRPALVCPCHYSTFDPAAGGKVLFGPAGRNLPQLPLLVDSAGVLRAGGNFSGPVGPSWWGVREEGAKS